MSLRFTKMHGLGNDFVLVETFDQVVDDPAALAVRISDRHTGVGADGLILVGPPGAADTDIRMTVFNADGSRARMCGNGIRCAAKLAYDHGWARRSPVRVETDHGVLPLDLTLVDDRVVDVRANLDTPILDPARIPVAVAGDRVVGHALGLEGITLSMTCVSLGSAHAVFFDPPLPEVPLAKWGPQIERHPLFPERVNVQFAQVVRRDYVGMFTWERGSGITRACGTGAAAVCVAGVLNDLTDAHITAKLPGGELRVHWDEQSGHVFIAGPAKEVFSGVWPS